MVVSGVLGDIGIAHAANVLRHIGSGASHSLGGVSGLGYVSVSFYVEESDSRDSPVVTD